MEAVKSTIESITAKASAALSGKKAVHFGSGNIGRGFVAEFLHKSGYEVVFVDVIDELIKQLQETPSYTVTEIDQGGETNFTISQYRAINSKNEEDKVVDEIATADIVTCAVGPNVLKFIAPVIAKAIDARTADKQIAVIACENAINGTDTLKGYIVENLKSTSETDLPNKARFANSAIDRIVPNQPPNQGLNVKIEKFHEWCVETPPFEGAKGGVPNLTGVHFVEDLNPFIERKLYTVNTGHAASAYYGYNRGKKLVQDALKDEEIKKIVHDVLEETATLIIDKHNISREEQDQYVSTIIERISNPYLEDVVERVGRAPLRKLGRKERFIGPAAELAERGEKVDALLGCIEMALRFQNVEGDDESAELAKILKEKDSSEATKELTGLESDHPLFSKVEEVVKKVQSG